MNKLKKRLQQLEGITPGEPPCTMAIKGTNGTYKVTTSKEKKRLSEREFQEYEKEHRVILMEPIS